MLNSTLVADLLARRISINEEFDGNCFAEFTEYIIIYKRSLEALKLHVPSTI